MADSRDAVDEIRHTDGALAPDVDAAEQGDVGGHAGKVPGVRVPSPALITVKA